MITPETETLEACPVCGSKEKKFLFTNTDRLHGIPGEFGLNQCLGCSVFYLSPRPTLETLPRYYPDDYYAHKIKENGFSQSDMMRRSRDFLRNTILYEVYHYKNYSSKPRIRPSLLAKPIAYLSVPLWKRAYYGLPRLNFPEYTEAGRVLDIGCGTGNYLRILRNLGWEVYGVEPSEKAVNAGRKEYGLDIRAGTLLDHRFPDNYFNFISMNHVLEHLPNPIETFAELKRIVHPDGMIVIRMPNIDSYVYRRFVKNSYHIDTPRHLILYSKTSFSYLCHITGLQIKNFLTSSSFHVFYESLEYEKRDNMGKHGSKTKDDYPLFERIMIKTLNLYVNFLILSGKSAGDELQAVLVKR